MRAWIALRAGDADATIRTESAESENPAEQRDLTMLRLVDRPGRESEPAERYSLLAELRALSTSEREFIQQIDLQMLEMAPLLPEDFRAERQDELRALLLRCRSFMGAQFDTLAAIRAQELGFEDLEQRFTRTTPTASTGGAAIGGAIGGAAIRRIISNQGSSSPADPMEKIREFTANQRPEAAAREAWRVFRDRNNPQSRHHHHHFMISHDGSNSIVAALDEAGIEALVALAAPGESQSRTRRLEFVDLCELLGRDEQRVKLLEEMLAERPNDAEIAVRLAFSPGIADERVLDLMRTAASNSDEFATRANQSLSSIRSARDAEASIRAFDRVAAWLEASDPEEIANNNLTWVAHHARQFVEASFERNVGSMLRAPSDGDTPTELAQQRSAAAWRLMQAMILHNETAEAGFRMLHATRPPEMEEAQIDGFARQAITSVRRPMDGFGHSHQHFGLRIGTSMSSSGNEMEEHASWIWLAKRMNEADPLTVIPPDFLDELSATSPNLAAGLRRALAERATSIDGVAAIFIDQLATLEDATIVRSARNHYMGGESHIDTLVQTVLTTAISGDENDMARLAGEVRRVLIGTQHDWEAVVADSNNQYMLYQIEQGFGNRTSNPLAMVRARQILYQAGVPMTMGDYRNIQPFRDAANNDAAVVEQFLEDLGLLNDASTWKALAYIAAERSQVRGQTRMTLSTKPFLEEAIRTLISRNRTMRDELIKRLEAREDGKFGTLRRR